MSPGKDNITLPSGNDEQELDTLVTPGNQGSRRKLEEPCFLQRIMLQIDEQVSIKLLMKIWGPRLEFVVRCMLVATFLDDSLNSMRHFFDTATNIGEQGYPIKWFPEAVAFLLGAVLLSMELIVQIVGSLSILALTHIDVATKVLIGWTMAQPFIFGQVTNGGFVAESISIIGGLLILQQVKGSATQQTQFIGRLLLPAAYLHGAVKSLFSSMVYEETNSIADFFSSLSVFFITVAFVGVLVVCCGLVAIGLRSRTVALFLALFNLFFVCYTHPFLNFITFKDGQWEVKENMWVPNVSLPNGVSVLQLDGWMIFNLHRYYFFQGLSASGALLLLTQFGPGEIAAQSDEKVLPVLARAQD